MKQFIVDRHTTPSTPTLEQVPTEKIPIYDDIDAAAADLDYLTEGQIVATKDTGNELSNPVDAVESGNLHAATSNAVASAFKGMTIVECGKIPGREQYDDSWYIKYDSGIIEEWWVASSTIPALSGSPIAKSEFTVTYPIPLKTGTKAMQFDVYNVSRTGASGSLWFGTHNGFTDTNAKKAVCAFSFYAYSNLSDNVQFHVVGFWK